MTFNNLDSLPGKKLWLLSNRSFPSKTNLTDNVNIYGQMFDEGFVIAKSFLETTDETILVLNSTIGDLTIKTPEGKVIGYFENSSSRNTFNLKLNNGFRANFHSASFFSSEHYWTDENGINLIKITNMTPFVITLCLPITEIPSLNVLILVGVKTLTNRYLASIY